MKPIKHLYSAIPLGLGLYLATSRPGVALAGAAMAIFVDLDHAPDYLWWKKGQATPGDFVRANYNRQVPTLFLPLHGWESLALGTALLWFMAGPLWAVGLAAGWLCHLVLDQIGNRVTPFFYFLCYRAAFGFSRARLEGAGIPKSINQPEP